MQLTSHFNDLLAEIRPSAELLEECVKAHTELRETLINDPELKDVVVGTFLQGSYRRSTLTRPKEGSKPDVDIVLVTNLNPGDWTPARVQERFCKVLDKYPRYRGNYKRQGRSIGLSYGAVNLDLVVTAAPSEAVRVLLRSGDFGSAYSLEANPTWSLDRALSSGGQQWQNEPLLIPDRDANRWEETDPIAQIEWTHRKNARTNGHFVNVVKAVKWWWTQLSPSGHGAPKGYLIERLVGLHCPDGIQSVAQGFTETLEGIRDTYAIAVAQGITPFIQDVGIPANNVFKRVPPQQFSILYGAAAECASQARTAYNDPQSDSSAIGWAAIFGSLFPAPNNDNKASGNRASQAFQQPSRPAEPSKARFA